MQFALIALLGSINKKIPAQIPLFECSFNHIPALLNSDEEIINATYTLK